MNEASRRRLRQSLRLFAPEGHHARHPGRRQPRSADNDCSDAHEVMASPDFRYRLKVDPYSSHSVILSRLGPGRGRRLLDVGTAQGEFARLLSQQGFTVTGIELDPQLAGHARQTCTELVEVDLDRSIPEFRQPFDVIVYGDVLEHLKDPLLVFTGLNRYLAPEGKAVVSVPNIAHIAIRLMLLFGYFEYMDRGILDRTHLRFFTLRSFRRFLAQAGMRVEEMVVTPVPLPLLFPPRWQGQVFQAVHCMNALGARLSKRLLGYQFVAFGRLETKRCAPRSL